MKILATIPQASRSEMNFIVEITADEIRNITLLHSTYGKVTATDSKGLIRTCEVTELQTGDTLDPEEASVRRDTYAEWVNARVEAERAMMTLRKSMSRLQNIATPLEIP